MAGLEVVVRPMIFPAIRPAPRPSVLPAETDPEKGLAVIRGQSAKTIELPYSYSLSWTVTMARHEIKRTYDKARIYQQDSEGNVNRDNFVDVEIMKKVHMTDDRGDIAEYNYAPVAAGTNVEILEKNKTRKAPPST